MLHAACHRHVALHGLHHPVLVAAAAAAGAGEFFNRPCQPVHLDAAAAAQLLRLHSVESVNICSALFGVFFRHVHSCVVILQSPLMQLGLLFGCSQLFATERNGLVGPSPVCLFNMGQYLSPLQAPGCC